jgi:hypothetical protein
MTTVIKCQICLFAEGPFKIYVESKGEVCDNCAKEYEFVTEEEAEERSKRWWRGHWEMRAGRKLTDSEFEWYIMNGLCGSCK